MNVFFVLINTLRDKTKNQSLTMKYYQKYGQGKVNHY